MTAKIIPIRPLPETRTVEDVLAAAAETGLRNVVVIAEDADGRLWTDTNLIGNGHEVLWLLKLTERRLLDAAAPS